MKKIIFGQLDRLVLINFYFKLKIKLGPCGPCSELYYDLAPEKGLKEVDLDDDSRFIEFYNLVFMSLNRVVEGGGEGSMDEANFKPLKSKNIDTGILN